MPSPSSATVMLSGLARRTANKSRKYHQLTADVGVINLLEVAASAARCVVATHIEPVPAVVAALPVDEASRVADFGVASNFPVVGGHLWVVVALVVVKPVRQIDLLDLV